MELQNTTQSKMQLDNKNYQQVVSFSLGAEEYAIAITKIKEIILHEGVTRMPQMPDFIEGVINLRGVVIPVIDLRKRFELPCAEVTEQTRVMVIRMDGNLIGIIVDAVSQVLKIPKTQIAPPPDTIAGLAGDYLIGIGKVDDQMLILLDIDKIMTANEKESLNIASPKPEPAESVT